MSRFVFLIIALGLLVMPSWAAGQSPRYVPGEVVVKYVDGTSRSGRAETLRVTGTGHARATAPLERTLKIKDGQSVEATVAELRAQPNVAYAAPNLIAHAGSLPFPDDPGRGLPGDWSTLQWNFLPGTGVDAPGAWDHLAAVERWGGRGVTVAVLDTGVAYANFGHFRRSPDFIGTRFVRGFDFVDHDAHPNDENGHGTHVAGTIAERTNNRVGLTGLAFGARVMPVRVLDRRGDGAAGDIAAGIRYAAAHGAQVINLSLEFPGGAHASEIPEVISALHYAARRGAVIVAAAGNIYPDDASTSVVYPARADHVISVGSVTEHGCVSEFSKYGRQLDLVAPGGGADAADAGDPVHCRPSEDPGRDIFQLTFTGSVRRFGLPNGYEGTSMAAPHVAATAALVIASGVLGSHPTPAAIEQRIEQTTRDLGGPGWDVRYGAGMLDAAAATAPAATTTRKR